MCLHCGFAVVAMDFRCGSDSLRCCRVAVVVGWVIDGGGRLAIVVVVVAVEFRRFGCCSYGSRLSFYIYTRQRERDSDLNFDCFALMVSPRAYSGD